MFRLFTPLFTEIDKVTRTFAGDVSSRVIAAITPVVAAGLTLWFIVWGMLVIRGAVQQPVMEFLGKVIRTAIIVSIALGAGLYQDRVADLVRTVPDDLAGVVMSGGNRPFMYGLNNSPVVIGPQGSESGQGSLLDRVAGGGLAKAQDAFAKGSIFSEQGMAFYIFALLLLLATVFMVAVGGAMILTAKVMLALLAALGPLFIAGLLFDATKRFFERWVSMVATYGLVVVLVACVFTFMLAIFDNYMKGVALDGSMHVAYGIGGALILTIVSLWVLRESYQLAAGLGGGYAYAPRMPKFFHVYSERNRRSSESPSAREYRHRQTAGAESRPPRSRGAQS